MTRIHNSADTTNRLPSIFYVQKRPAMNFTAANRSAKPESVFKNFNFMLLFSGKVVSGLGDQIYAFALSWFVLEITQSGLMMSYLLVINNVIYAGCAPLGGIIADRRDRKQIMIWMDIIRGMIVIGAAWLLYHHWLSIWMLYASAIFLALGGGIFAPAASAIIPTIVQENQLPQSSSLDQFVWSFCSIAGMVISGALYSWVGIFAIFAFNAISYFCSAIAEFLVKIPIKNAAIIQPARTIRQELHKIIRELGEGWQYLRNNKLVYDLVLMYAWFNLIVYPVGMLFIPYSFNVILKTTPLQLSLALGSLWIGIIISSFIVPVLLHRYRLKQAIFRGLGILSICWVIMPLLIFSGIKSFLNLNHWQITFLFMAVSIILGAALTGFSIPINVIFQKQVADEYRGRFWGLQTALLTLTSAIGYLIGGFLIQRVEIIFLFFGAALLIFILNLWVIQLKEIQELK